jgi:hypothetical protein
MDGTNLLPIVAALALASLVIPLLVRLARRSRGAPGAGPGGATVPDPDAFTLTGTSGLLAWTAEVVVGRVEGAGRQRAPRHRTRLTFPAVRAAPGRFVLVMALPPGVKVPPAPALGAGFLAGLAAKAMEALLDLYVTGYFGAEHRALVDVAGAERPPGPDGLFVLSTDPALAVRLLDAEGIARLTGLRDAPPPLAPSRDGAPPAPAAQSAALAGFGLLATPDGLVYGIQASLREPAQVRDLAARVARVAERLGG